MAKNPLESVVRELQKTVVTLVGKIESLEARIDAQSTLISKLNPPCDKIATRKSTTPAVCIAAPTTESGMQRPVRSARANASLAIAELSKPAKKRGNVCATEAVTPKIASQCGDVVQNSIDKTSQIKSKIDEHCKTSNATHSTAVANKQMDSMNLGHWQTVGRNNKIKKPQRPITVGTGNVIGELRAAERIKFIQAWSFRPDTTTGQVLSFLNNIAVSQYTVEKRNIRSETHASFVIGMPEAVYETVTTPTAWPPKVCFVDWFPVRPRLQRGDARTGCSA